MYHFADKTQIQTRLTMDKQNALGLKSDPRATGTPVWKRHPADISPISRIIYGHNGSRHAREHGEGERTNVFTFYFPLVIAGMDTPKYGETLRDT